MDLQQDAKARFAVGHVHAEYQRRNKVGEAGVEEFEARAQGKNQTRNTKFLDVGFITPIQPSNLACQHCA